MHGWLRRCQPEGRDARGIKRILAGAVLDISEDPPRPSEVASQQVVSQRWT